MGINRKKEISLYKIFINYLITFCISSILILFFLIYIFAIGVNLGILLPANYAQNRVEALKTNLENSDVFNKNDIPPPYKYGFYNKDLKIIDSDFNEKQLNESLKYLKGESFKTKYIYTKVDFNNGICVISYDIKVHFFSRYLDSLLPLPELILIILFIVLFIIMSSILVIKFGKSLKKELYPIMDSTNRIKNKDLDFETEPTNIKEFNHVLNSISNMKSALKESLESQWNIEQKKKEQISALAHDIKTPLTIIKGNAELLLENNPINEDLDYINYIIKNADKIENYISTLIQLSKAENEIDNVIEEISSDIFLKDLVNEFNMLCKYKNNEAITKINKIPKSFYGNKELLTRALINIISNAVDYSPLNSKIELIVNLNKDKLSFTIKDEGPGFTKEGLKNATNQFYMENSERKVGEHYGMGLYIASTIAKKHGGEVLLKNTQTTSGAQVTFNILLKPN